MKLDQRALWLFALSMLSGCSGATHGTVQGTVKVDGQSAKVGSIAFFPTDGKSPTTGAVIQDGAFRADVPLGASKVEIRISKEVGKKKLYDTPDSPEQTILAEVLPPKYNDQTELTVEVVPGITEKDFDLSSK